MRAISTRASARRHRRRGAVAGAAGELRGPDQAARGAGAAPVGPGPRLHGIAQAFEAGRYRQDRGFVAQIGAQILDPKAHVFELLDNQRKAFTLWRATIDGAFHSTSRRKPSKKVVIIEGPPGSGKSVIAARLWASLVTDPEFPEGDVVFTTTSMSQNKNWGHLFKKATGVEAASGVLRTSNSYSPITTQRLGTLRKKHGEQFLEGAEDWREHLQTLEALGEPFRDGTRDDQNLVPIVDEAHALINPEHVDRRARCMTID